MSNVTFTHFSAVKNQNGPYANVPIKVMASKFGSHGHHEHVILTVAREAKGAG